jgi:membrane-associated phospholipid phosphatase
MPFEETLLLAIHARGGPALDVLFRFSHQLGTFPFCALVVLGAAAWCLRHRPRREAWLWLGVGVSTYAIQEALKFLVARPRPALWPALVPQSGYSFPSGHALAAATFYPLLAWTWARARPGEARAAWGVAILLASYIGFGRLYLGVHWPTDVLAGWSLGAVQTALVVRAAGGQNQPAI